MGDIDFKFNVEQKEQYNNILRDTKQLYPHLFKDEISEHRVKVIIAHNVIFGDDSYNKEVETQEFTEVK
jgi:hypothetical protein